MEPSNCTNPLATQEQKLVAHLYQRLGKPAHLRISTAIENAEKYAKEILRMYTLQEVATIVDWALVHAYWKTRILNMAELFKALLEPNDPNNCLASQHFAAIRKVSRG